MINESPLNKHSKPKILILSHKQQQCGVYQFGWKIAEALKKSARYNFVYAECSSPEEYLSIVGRIAPAAIIYNYYPSTMPWLKKKLMQHLKIPHIGILHEVSQQAADSADSSFFQYHIAPDPTLLLKNPVVFKTGRLVPRYDNAYPLPAVPTIGSFGFGTKGKGFEHLITSVQKEYDEVHIRLHIPFAAFGDSAGIEARTIADKCKLLIVKPGIKLSITHDFLSNEQLLDFLAQNTLNAFFYEENKGRGISSVIDLSLAAQRPIAISRSNMFRHLLSATPSICVDNSSLHQIVQNGFKPLMPYYKEWCEENLIWDYERIIENILNETAHADEAYIVSPITRFLRSALRRIVAGPITRAHVESWIPQIKDGVLQAPVISDEINIFTALPNVTSFNRILDDAARRQYERVIGNLFEIVPDMMKHKIREANIQQAFVLDTVYRFTTRLPSPNMLCIGSYGDTAAASLKKLGFRMDEVDPVLNYDLNAFFHKPTTIKESYNIIFSTSVIEHVKNDELFVDQIAALLAPGGIAVLTCDYNDQYKPGDRLPKEDFRFYTQNDFRHRFLPLLKNCSLLDEPHWDCPSPDFHYSGCTYTFASFVFKKNLL